MKRLEFAIIALCTLASPALAQAPTWCSTQSLPNTSFCEDFDRYCNPAPPYPAACDPSAVADNFRLRLVWVPNYPGNYCGVEIQLRDEWAASPPWDAAMSSQVDDMLGMATRDLPASIRQAFGESYSEVMATDLNPLVLEFVLNGENWSKCIYDDGYLELGFGPPSVPTDFIRGPDCSTCGGPATKFPMICQQAVPPPGCGPIATAPHKPAIAVGFVAFLDDDPCHCDETSPISHSPYNEHLSFFDGHKWWKLKQGLFPNGSGDFRIRNDRNIIKLTLDASTIKVEMTCTDPEPDEYSWCVIPRDYTGPFNTMTVGYNHSCRLKGAASPGSEWDCLNEPICVWGADKGYAPHFDNIILHGGMGYGQPGACCYPDTTCGDEYYLDCESLGGVFRGHGTSCALLSCPPPFKPDHDMDGDVDLEDFAWFQACLSGTKVTPTIPCQVADLDDDTDVDSADLLAFITCLSGPAILYTEACLP